MTLAHDGSVALTIPSVTHKDAGLYTCVAINVIGRTECSANVEIIDGIELTNGTVLPPEEIIVRKDIPLVLLYFRKNYLTKWFVQFRYSKTPKFLKKPMSTEAFEGDNIVILCEIIGDPKPEVVWLRDFLKVSNFFFSISLI